MSLMLATAPAGMMIAIRCCFAPRGRRVLAPVPQLRRADWREAWALFPGSVAYIWHPGTKAGIVQDSLAACGFETRSQIILANAVAAAFVRTTSD
jgi:hypothetical protein